eukprot:111057-Karenia_brevis.AAC.1
MLNVKVMKDELPHDYFARTRKMAIQVLMKTTGMCSARVLSKHWHYVGHCLRNPWCNYVIRQMLQYRDDEWWDKQKSIPWKWRTMHRKPGRQLQRFERK